VAVRELVLLVLAKMPMKRTATASKIITIIANIILLISLNAHCLLIQFNNMAFPYSFPLSVTILTYQS